MSRISYLDSQLQRLSREWSAKKAYSQFQQYDEQRASPSCPPDFCIHIRGGWLTSGLGDQVRTPDLVEFFGDPVDLPSGADSAGGVGAFTNADYYKAVVVCRSHLWDATEEQFGTYATVNWVVGNLRTEYSTAQCAEAYSDWFLRNTIDYYYGYPICIVILKNDGVTGAANHILPIDAVNRGRSYLWRDIRPLMKIPYPTARVVTASPEPTCT